MFLQVSVSVTLDPRKFDNLDLELSLLKVDLSKIAKVSTRDDLSIISLWVSQSAAHVHAFLATTSSCEVCEQPCQRQHAWHGAHS